MKDVDRKTIRVLLAALDIEVQELAKRMAYDEGYVVNVLNGFTVARPGFRRAFGETIGALMLGTYEPRIDERYPAGPLVALIERRAAAAPRKRDFYRDLGTSRQALRKREWLDGIFVDRICCALGVHPASVCGDDILVAEAS